MEGWPTSNFQSGAPTRSHYFNRYAPAGSTAVAIPAVPGGGGGAKAAGYPNHHHQAGGDYISRPASAAPIYTPFNQQFGASPYGE